MDLKKRNLTYSSIIESHTKPAVPVTIAFHIQGVKVVKETPVDIACTLDVNMTILTLLRLKKLSTLRSKVSLILSKRKIFP